MDKNSGNYRESIDFVVGAEKRLIDVIAEAEIMPLLDSARKAGMARVVISDVNEVALWGCGNGPIGSLPSGCGEVCGDLSFAIMLEGEPVGTIRFSGGGLAPEISRAIGKVVAGAVNSLINANLKRMLTTEIHTVVVNQSYEELLESNRQLSVSEKKYRDLSESLELRVLERTEELKRVYTRMLQQEKLASVGQLAAGVAHEINNPLGFVLSNLNTLQKYVARFKDMLEFYRHSVPNAQAQAKWQELKLDFISADLSELFEQSIVGAQRVKKIVADLKGFSHVDESGEGPVDLIQEIERTLSVLTMEIPADARIVKKFAPIPVITGQAALFCQVFLNLIRNAIQSRKEGLQLVIQTEVTDSSIRVVFADNGPGIADPIRHRIFEPFFTTREVGQGMGMGLSVVYDVVSGYGGTIELEHSSEPGARFVIVLPLTKKGLHD